jgi:hypothetical protein
MPPARKTKVNPEQLATLRAAQVDREGDLEKRSSGGFTRWQKRHFTVGSLANRFVLVTISDSRCA